MTTTFERGFAEAERSAQAALKAAAQIANAARSLQRAAREGDIGRLRRAADHLAKVANETYQTFTNARTAWPFTASEEKEYMADSFEQELIEEARRSGLAVHSQDGRLLAFPSILQVLPNDLSVRVDRRRVTAIRPSHLVKTLLANQKRISNYAPERFIETLYRAYTTIVGRNGMGNVIRLAQVYDVLTLLPGVSSEYGKSEFARDIFFLDRSGVAATRSGARLSLPASTGTRGGGSSVFTFVSPEGEVVRYYGLKFTEPA